MMSLLPILIMFILLFIVIFLSVSKGIKLKKALWWVVVGYILVGIVALIYLVLSTKDAYTLLSKEEMQHILKEQKKNWSLIDQDRVDELNKDDYLIDKLSYTLPTDELFINAISQNYLDVRVVVKWRDDPTTNEIFVEAYRIPYVLEGLDLTDKLPENLFDFSNSELIIYDVPKIDLSFYKLSPTIEMVENFRGWDLGKEEIFNYSVGTTILYLNVPKHVTIIDEDGLRIYPSTYE